MIKKEKLTKLMEIMERENCDRKKARRILRQLKSEDPTGFKGSKVITVQEANELLLQAALSQYKNKK